MQTVQLYIYVDGVGHRIELFNDEKISVTSSIANFREISTLFTDYSQTFTIPASKHNNAIFRHWYESAVGDTNVDNQLNVDNAFDHRVKYYGFIEIDTVPFRDGKFVMQQANKKNGYIESYTINFVGNLSQLSDLFLEDKIGSLDYSSIQHQYTPAEVIDRIESSGYVVKYPLFGSKIHYTYNDGFPTDVTIDYGDDTAVKWNELFPAIPISEIFDRIQSTYGVGFSGSIFDEDNEQFTNLHFYCKNGTELTTFNSSIPVTFTSSTTGMPIFGSSLYTSWGFSTSQFRRQTASLTITGTGGVNFNIRVYRNGLLFNTYTNLIGGATVNFYDESYVNDQGAYNWYFIVDSDAAVFNFSATLTYKTWTGNPLIPTTYVATGSGLATTPVMDVAKFMPELKINDFLTAFVKMFNLVIIPTGENTFFFQTLEEYYQRGRIVDITEYTQADTIDISKPKLFKRLDFKYEKSENILNTKYRNLNNLEYGDLFFDNPNSAFTEKYEVKLPFENPMCERTTGYNFETCSFININLQPYTPKPVLMYLNGLLPDPLVGGDRIQVWTEALITPTAITNYNRFSNEYNAMGSDLSYLYSLNWGVEFSPWYLQPAPKGLYNRYYQQYIENLYNQRTRVIKAKSQLGPFLLTSIRLNDRIVLSNKRYIINTMTTDLTTGEVNFELISDYRNQTSLVELDKPANVQSLIVNHSAQTVQVICLKNNWDTFDVKTPAGFLSYTTSTDNEEDVILNVTIPINSSGVDRTDAIILEGFKNGVGTFIYIPVYQYA